MQSASEIGTWAALAVAAIPGVLALMAGQGERKNSKALAILALEDKSHERESKDEQTAREFVQAQFNEIIKTISVERDGYQVKLRDAVAAADARELALTRRIRGLEEDFEKMRARARFWNDKAHKTRHDALNRMAYLVLKLSRAIPPIDFVTPDLDTLPTFEDETTFGVHYQRFEEVSAV